MNKDNQVYLAPLLENDISVEYINWMNDPEIMKYTESGGKNYCISDLQAYVLDMNNSPNNVLMGVFLKSSNVHIGNIKIGNVSETHKYADVGFIIGNKQYWGKGYATQAIQEMLKLASEKLGLYKVFAGVYANNIGSIKALKKSGFIECGRFKDHCVIDEERVDVLHFEIFFST